MFKILFCLRIIKNGKQYLFSGLFRTPWLHFFVGDFFFFIPFTCAEWRLFTQCLSSRYLNVFFLIKTQLLPLQSKSRSFEFFQCILKKLSLSKITSIRLSKFLCLLHVSCGMLVLLFLTRIFLELFFWNYYSQ